VGRPRKISFGQLREKPASTSMFLNPSILLLSKVVVENDGALMVVKLGHFANAKIEILMRFSGKCTEVSDVHL